MRFAGKHALVTGGARGIGYGIVEALATEGAGVALVDRDADALDAAKTALVGRGASVETEVMDVADANQVRDAVEALASRLGHIDILVNNAGICPFEDFFEIEPETWERVMAVNLGAHFVVSQAVARVMRQYGGGAIVNVTSISGEMVTNAQQVAYCTSKAGANMLTRALAVVLAPYGIRVNAVLPGTVPTDINAGVLAQAGVADAIRAATPLGSLGQPGDIAAAVCYLASDDARWVTGALLAVDGGYVVNGTR